MRIPLVDLNEEYQNIKNEIDDSIKEIINSTMFIMGYPVGKFEKNLSKYCVCKYAIGVSSGTSALFLALKAYGIKPGDEVITVPNTFIATAEAIVNCGAKPVFVDIEENTMLMDVNKIEEKITSRTKAIIPVHLYGQICDMDKILNIAKKHGLIVIEDAAQAIDAEYKNLKLPISETAIFSFFPAKNLGCYGDGGAVITNNKEIHEKIVLLRDHGRIQKYESVVVGYGERLDAIQAAILDVKLKYLRQRTDQRRENAYKYNEFLKDYPDIITPTELADCRHVYYMYVVKVQNRSKIINILSDRGIATGIHYPIPLHLQKAFNYLKHKPGDFPVSEKIANEIISIPVYPEISESKIEYIADCLKDAVEL